MNEKQFLAKVADLGVNLNANQLKQFDIYLKMLQIWNEKINLTAIVEDEAVYALHFYDSLLPFLKLGIKEGRLCDVGAGAGFPSIPIKIVMPQLEITIIEPLNKRCLFLKELVSALELDNVNICNERAEDFATDHRESFDYVSARAVANLSILAELCIPLIKIDALFIALKGSSGEEEMAKASNACDILGVKMQEVYKEKVGEHTHINLVYKKIKKTPAKYPRGYAKIKKDPL